MHGDFRLLVFDWDGTLMDSVAAIVACMQAVVERLGLAAVPEEMIREAVGLASGEVLEALLPGSSAEVRGRVFDCYRDMWMKVFRERPEPFPGVEELLETLAEEGYLLAVATGKSRRGLGRDLEMTGLGRFLHATRTAEESFPKPHPRMVLEILDELGAEPGETLVIGDTTWDLEMARNAGVSGLGVASGSHRRDDLARCGPVGLLSNVLELKPWLDGGGTEEGGETPGSEGALRRAGGGT